MGGWVGYLAQAGERFEGKGLDEEVGGLGRVAEEGGVGHHIREVVTAHAGEAEGRKDLEEVGGWVGG